MKLETERDANQWIWAARSLSVVAAWTSLGLFERLRAGPVLQADLPANPRAIAATLPVLAHLGLIASNGQRVALTPTAERLVAEGGMPTERNLAILRDCSRMADVMRDGGPVRDDEGKSKATRGGASIGDPEATARFMDMLYRLSEEPARSTYTWLSEGLPPRASVLDLGGGHGRYARAFADAGHAATLYDQPEVIALARKRHGDALRYREGDFHTEQSFGGPHDLVLICNVVHGESAQTNASIVARAARGLRAGGRIAIRDMFIDELGQNPPSAVFFGLTMLLYTEGGASPTVRQAEQWLADAGLGDFRMTVLETHLLIVGRRA
jgi:SAM-dependent methyltransferase